jgi:hypothetical protein
MPLGQECCKLGGEVCAWVWCSWLWIQFVPVGVVVVHFYKKKAVVDFS